MPDRKYETRPRAVVTVSDSGEVQVEVDLIHLPFQMENDYLAGHNTDEVAEDIERVRTAFLATPLNHTVTTTLKP
jgi:NAD(P)H-dependent FMN reductase